MGLESTNWKRELWIGDNLPIMRGINSETVDLIYLDPPFNSKRMYEGSLDPEMGKQSFSDIWDDSAVTEDDRRILRNQLPQCAKLIDLLGESHGVSWRSYLSFMGIRLYEMHRMLKNTGSIYLHCDWHMNAPLRLVMDEVFGARNFLNEIVWWYSWGVHTHRYWNRKHDNLLYYAKNIGSVFFDGNNARVPYREGSIMTQDPKWNKKYNPDGKLPEDVFDIPTINAMSKERTGWATQKPVALLERVIKASSNNGDVIFDPFCGCATACVAAERLDRQWIGIDQHESAGKIMQKRIEDEREFAKIHNRTGKGSKGGKIWPEWQAVQIREVKSAADLPKRTDKTPFRKTAADKQTLYEMQGGRCASGKLCLNGPIVHPVNFMQFDRKVSGKRGGVYEWGNVHLLCSTCNISKGKKTWKQFQKYLLDKQIGELAKQREENELNDSE